MEKRKRPRRREHLKLDPSLRMLFTLSKPLTIQLMNGLFGERHKVAEVSELRYGNMEFVTDQLERLRGDWFLEMETVSGIARYHVEFQTMNDREMVIRLFRYGLEKAWEWSRSGERHEPIELQFPQQTVIFLEENADIGEELWMRLRLPDGSKANYRVPVIRYWLFSAEQLRRRQLYALLPLQVFHARKRLRQIAESTAEEAEKRQRTDEEFARLQDKMEDTLKVIRELLEADELSIEAADKMLRVMDHVMSYLYRRYGRSFRTLQREVSKMAKSYLDWTLYARGKEEGREEGREAGEFQGALKAKLEVAKQLLGKQMDLTFVAEVTGLSPEQLRHMK